MFRDIIVLGIIAYLIVRDYVNWQQTRELIDRVLPRESNSAVASRLSRIENYLEYLTKTIKLPANAEQGKTEELHKFVREAAPERRQW